MRKLSTREQMAYRTIATLELELDAALGREKSERLRGDVDVADCNDAERREAALREELRKWKETAWRHSQDRDSLQQRLTVAEKREGELEGLFRDQATKVGLVISSLEFDERLRGSNPERSTLDFPHAIRILSQVKDALKPDAEGEEW